MLKDFLPVVEYLGLLQGVALILFFSFFVFLIIWVFRLDKFYVKEMEALPLDNKNPEIKISGGQNE
jgi:hypothetical protein